MPVTVEKPRVLGLVPARGGSKGIPRKNIRELGGEPLLAWTARSARAATRLSRLVLSTEDDEIAEVGRRCGLEVPFLRPAALASDEASSLDVVIHALEALEEPYDAVCLLQPTDPFRSPELIDDCVDALFAQDATSVVSVRPVPTRYHPSWVYVERADGELSLFDGGAVPRSRRQDLPSAFIRSGAVYVTRAQTLLEDRSLYGDRLVGVEDRDEPDINLDTMDDWRAAEDALRRR